jgi:hypothetical protein
LGGLRIASNESLARSSGLYSSRNLYFSRGRGDISGSTMKTRLGFTRHWPLRPQSGPEMTLPAEPIRYRAIAMELAAYLNEQYVEMRILTDTGRIITVACNKNSIFSLQRHIEQIGRECPEISAWKPAMDTTDLHGSNRRAYEAAMWEGWPAS